MAKKGRSRSRAKHVPQRTCVGCREVLAKRELLRLVRTPDGVWPDPTGKLNGRGAYVHANQDCLRRALKGGLEGALRTQLSAEDRERLEALMAELPAAKAVAANKENK
jgi:predicted RNA-binding protein YlxR (DUF448 family)